MKIFISWSGELSKSIAEIFRQWIPGVIQAVKPYYSQEDITKGARWNQEISKELEASKIGIICLTKENLESPWIMFEAGALSKNMENSKVVPLLFGIDPADIQGPLVQFQASKFSKSEMKKVIKMVNSELGEGSLSLDVLENVFDMWWGKLEQQIKDAEERASKTNNKNSRTERDLLEEVLSLTREISITRRFERDRPINLRTIEEIVNSVVRITETIMNNSYYDLIEYVRDLHRPLEYLIEDTMSSEHGLRKDFYMRYRNSRIILENSISKIEPKIVVRREPKSDTEE